MNLSVLGGTALCKHDLYVHYWVHVTFTPSVSCHLLLEIMLHHAGHACSGHGLRHTSQAKQQVLDALTCSGIAHAPCSADLPGFCSTLALEVEAASLEHGTEEHEPVVAGLEDAQISRYRCTTPVMCSTLGLPAVNSTELAVSSASSKKVS